jgi:ATP-dependent DNA ligase
MKYMSLLAVLAGCTCSEAPQPEETSPAFWARYNFEASSGSARMVDKLPEGDDWMYGMKFDGYRALLMQQSD